MRVFGGLHLLLLAGLAACGPPAALDRLAAGEQGRVADIVSGDTLRLDSGLEVRLAGIDAPRAPAPYAEEARKALQRLADGRLVALHYGGARRDRYGRAIAQVTLRRGGTWLQQALLRSGAVRVHTWPDNRALAGVLLEDEAYARNHQIGLWKLPAYRVLLPGEATDTSGFQVVEARVRSLGPSYGQGARLELTSRPGVGLEAVIPARAQQDFKAAGKAAEQLRGRHLRLRGYIDDRTLRLDHPEQVEWLKEQD